LLVSLEKIVTFFLQHCSSFQNLKLLLGVLKHGLDELVQVEPECLMTGVLVHKLVSMSKKRLSGGIRLGGFSKENN
jgi:hypothetical protein